MKPTICALILTTCATLAIADPPAPSVYAVIVWQSPTGAGVAYTIGPVTLERCQSAVAKARGDKSSPLPPDMQLVVARCSGHQQVGSVMAAFGCQAQRANPVPKFPDAQAWLYSCLRL